ncbi:hypothetical protein L9F63_025655 [Diploptera punctata]|uniref:BRCT domain-containing protein n=1 Tax=Diploptera punctata TaxID=6984 RepID=A0AAD8E3M8_DIPPU|nr:hypothetical protein L9F63_025655 [Diploptera punctata]
MSSFLDIAELDFSFYGGQICQNIEESTTHVIICTELLDRIQEIKNLNRVRSKKLHIVSEQWVYHTVKHQQRQDENNYCV